MAFIWNPNPNPPAPIPPPEIGSGELSSQVHVVANTVNAGGTVSYNTPNVGFDVIYQLDSLNVSVLRTGTLNSEQAVFENMTANVATINTATISTAAITNATINVGYLTGNISANSSMVTKEYVDNAIASISGGAGPDSTANLFITKGDLLVGFAPNTAHRLGVGSDGQVLAVRNSANVNVAWGAVSSSTVDVGGLLIGTHWHPTLKLSQILLQKVNGITMNDGEIVTGWDGLVADLSVSGAGGRDSNSASAANTWYEVWAIRNSTTGVKALLLHRMVDYVLDANYQPITWGSYGPVYLRYGTQVLSNPNQRYIEKVSQSFRPLNSLPIKYIQLATATQQRPIGSMWISIQGDDGTGNADGVNYGTSHTLDATNSDSSGTCVTTFVFDTAVNVTAGGKYLMVVEGDWTYNRGPGSTDANMVAIYANTPITLNVGQQAWMANVGYNAGGSTYLPYSTDPSTSSTMGYGDCRCWNIASGRWTLSSNTGSAFPVGGDLWFKIFVEDHNTSLALPTGFNQRSLISYACTNQAGQFKEYHQFNRTMSMGYEDDWFAYAGYPPNIWGNQFPGVYAVDLRGFVPPVPTTTQFVGIQQDINSQGIVLGLYTMAGMYFVAAYESAGTAGNPKGTYGFGGFITNHTMMSKMMPLDGIPVINHRNFGGYIMRLHVANITF